LLQLLRLLLVTHICVYLDLLVGWLVTFYGCCWLGYGCCLQLVGYIYTVAVGLVTFVLLVTFTLFCRLLVGWVGYTHTRSPHVCCCCTHLVTHICYGCAVYGCPTFTRCFTHVYGWLVVGLPHTLVVGFLGYTDFAPFVFVWLFTVVRLHIWLLLVVWLKRKATHVVVGWLLVRLVTLLLPTFGYLVGCWLVGYRLLLVCTYTLVLVTLLVIYVWLVGWLVCYALVGYFRLVTFWLVQFTHTFGLHGCLLVILPRLVVGLRLHLVGWVPAAFTFGYILVVGLFGWLFGCCTRLRLFTFHTHTFTHLGWFVVDLVAVGCVVGSTHFTRSRLRCCPVHGYLRLRLPFGYLWLLLPTVVTTHRYVLRCPHVTFTVYGCWLVAVYTRLVVWLRLTFVCLRNCTRLVIYLRWVTHLVLPGYHTFTLRLFGLQFTFVTRCSVVVTRYLVTVVHTVTRLRYLPLRTVTLVTRCLPHGSTLRFTPHLRLHGGWVVGWVLYVAHCLRLRYGYVVAPHGSLIYTFVGLFVARLLQPVAHVYVDFTHLPTVLVLCLRLRLHILVGSHTHLYVVVGCLHFTFTLFAVVTHLHTVYRLIYVTLRYTRWITVVRLVARLGLHLLVGYALRLLRCCVVTLLLFGCCYTVPVVGCCPTLLVVVIHYRTVS